VASSTNTSESSRFARDVTEEAEEAAETWQRRLNETFGSVRDVGVRLALRTTAEHPRAQFSFLVAGTSAADKPSLGRWGHQATAMVTCAMLPPPRARSDEFELSIGHYTPTAFVDVVWVG
jgi:hypothetical protein